MLQDAGRGAAATGLPGRAWQNRENLGPSLAPFPQSQVEAVVVSRRWAVAVSGGPATGFLPTEQASIMANTWYYSPDGRSRLGPFSLDELRQEAREGRLKPSHMVRRDDMQKWTP